MCIVDVFACRNGTERNVPGWFSGAISERPPKNTPGREEAEQKSRSLAQAQAKAAQQQAGEAKQQQQAVSSLFCQACDKEFAKDTYVR